MKIAKRIVALLLSLLLCLSLCSCMELDAMRAQHALQQEDGTVLWDGKTFVPYSSYTLRELQEMGFGVDYWSTLQLTDADVPVLLSNSQFGRTIFVTADAMVLTSYAQDLLYIREEDYDSCAADIAEIIGEYHAKKMGTQYELRFYVSQVGKYCNIPLSASQKAVIDHVLIKEEPERSEPKIYVDGADIMGYNIFGDRVATVATLIRRPDGPYCLVVKEAGLDLIYTIPQEQADELAAAYDAHCVLLGTAAEDWPPQSVTFYEG